MTLGIVAPSSPTLERSQIARGVRHLEQMGFRVELAPHVRDFYGYLAGSDEDRAADLLAMLERDDIDAIICMRGGYGALRTAMALDRERLRKLRGRPAKAFVGYSDITVLHALLYRELGWTTFYGPHVTTFGRARDYTVEAFQRALMENEPFEVLPDPDDPYVETLVPGQAEGPLLGGCLSLLVSLIGTPWELDLDGAIFFFEDVNEEPYRLDRMLAQLVASGRLQRCAGIVVGEHADCRAAGGGSTLGVEQVFDDLIRPLGIPALYHLPIGHGRHLATLPLGVRAGLDATNRRLCILEPGVQ
jgi:muramoyltetrapeptide carboxypeptidase